MNKSLLTNLISASITVYGLFSPVYSTEIFMAGLFAFSGGVTNWLAIHMLFEKIPLLYGSGVIPNRFQEFKDGLRELIMREFFSSESLSNFLKTKKLELNENVGEKLNYDLIFQKLLEAIQESSLGSMLNMMGGSKALLPLKEPIKIKIKEVFDDLSLSIENNEDTIYQLKENIEIIIDKRLNELTPEHIKIIMKNMIKKHLGWLVIWGGVFGFLIGIMLGILGNIN